ncbi:MAG: prepilin-type N-terminal cleavage/methylation domain-containing protein [Synergistaceae bacterium]|nr:prepilin-type N-terminal cleavage/methylation domain-containing protein [Synergistaceae bacterium]
MIGIKTRNSPKKRAFTLVELLIVVVIIGILAGMVMLSAESAINSAKAARIISDIRTMKSAALLYKADNGSWPIWFYDEGSDSYKTIPPGSPGPASYSDLVTKGDGYWVGAMKVSNDHSIAFSVADVRDVSKGVKRSLENQAEKSGLYGGIFVGPSYQPDMDNLPKFNYTNSGHDMLLSVISK